MYHRPQREHPDFFAGVHPLSASARLHSVELRNVVTSVVDLVDVVRILTRRHEAATAETGRYSPPSVNATTTTTTDPLMLLLRKFIITTQ